MGRKHTTQHILARLCLSSSTDNDEGETSTYVGVCASLALIPRTNLLALALYVSHSDSSFGYRCIAVTAVRAVCVFSRKI